MSQKVLACIQARMSSTRFPGKVLKQALGRSLLSIEYDRISRSALVTDIVILTSTSTCDDVIVEFCVSNNIPYFRGSEEDLLDRHYKCALSAKADLVLKLPSDSPLMDPGLVDIAIRQLIENNFDYVSNYHPPTFPDGMDVEVFTFDSLQRAWFDADKLFQREHTTPYIWDSPDVFSIGNFLNPYGDLFMSHRWTVDYPEDLELIRSLLEAVSDHLAPFSTLLETYNTNPHLHQINSKYNGVNWYRHHPGELKTVSSEHYRQEPI